jgi:hypothetical protein
VLAMKKMSRTRCMHGDLRPDSSIARLWHSFTVRQRCIDVCSPGCIDRRRGHWHAVVWVVIEYMA